MDDRFTARIRRLRFRLLTRRRSLLGFQVSRSVGEGLEFEDYREYAAGDDLRHVDPFLAARLGKFYIKRYAAEEAARVALLLDRSASMGFGEPDKFTAARETALGLAAIALSGGDGVALLDFADRPGPPEPPVAGPPRLAALRSRLAALPCGGGTALAPALDAFLHRSDRFDLLVVLSDLLTLEPAQELLHRVRRQKCAVHLVAFAAPGEFAVPAGMPLRLVDAETGEERDVELNARLEAQLHGARDAHHAALAARFRAAGVPLTLAPTGLPRARLFLETLRRDGLLA